MKSLEISIKSFFILLILTLMAWPENVVLCTDVSDILMCDDVDVFTQIPSGIGQVFFTHSSKIYCWVNLTNVYIPHDVRFDWHLPNGTLFHNFSTVVEAPIDNGYWSSYKVTDYIKIQGSIPMNNTGIWEVKLYIDNMLFASQNFEIMDYGEVMDLIREINFQISNITINYYQLRINYEDQILDYNELLYNYSNLNLKYSSLGDNYSDISTSYNRSKKNYEDLIITYTNLIKEYEEIMDSNEALQKDYNVLINEYDSLSLTYDLTLINYQSTMKNLNSTKILLYGSIAGVIILIAILIYSQYFKNKG